MASTGTYETTRRSEAQQVKSSQPAGTVQAVTASAVIVLFIASVISPAYFFIAGMNLTFSRLLLLVLFIPLLLRLVSGKAGRILAADYFFIAYSIWLIVSLVYHHGMERFAFASISVVEQLGAYLVGRTLIRNATDYYHFIRVFFYSLLILFPWALIELFTNKNIWNDVFGIAFNVPYKGASTYGRMGMERVMSGFEHPILFGLYCSLGIANFFYIYRDKLARALPMMGFAGGMTFMSLSSAPLLAAGSQLCLIAWDQIMKGRWKLLVILTSIAYVVIDLLSNRTPVTILISTLTFNAGTAWTRIAIWDYGFAAVLKSPVFGIGMTSVWNRPFWLTSSVDNFWLVIMLRHGLVGFGLIAISIAFVMKAIFQTKGLSEEAARYRTGYSLALIAILFTLCTVHIWGASSSFVMFYFGAGLWLCSSGGKTETPAPETITTKTDRTSRLTRHSPSPTRSEPRERPLPKEAPVTQSEPASGRHLPKTRFRNTHKRSGPPQ
jgi:O-antigen ligase